MIEAVIIHDIPETISVLKLDLENYCRDIGVVGSAEGVVSGAEVIKELRPDLVFLDIQMQDRLGFDLLKILPDTRFNLIFTAASNEFATKAFKFSAIDYLLMPIAPDELMDVVSKIQDRNQPAERIDLLRENFHQLKLIGRNALDKIYRVNVGEIL